MGEEDLGSPGFRKSLQSLSEVLAALEREAGYVFGRSGAAPARDLLSMWRRLAKNAHGGVDPIARFAALLAPGGLDMSSLMKFLAHALGLTDLESFEQVRADVHKLADQVSSLRERELALAGGVSQLRAHAARFEQALAALARVQGKCVARLDGQLERASQLEQLAARRDGHITRLIRDTAGQRAELERLSRELALVHDQASGNGAQQTREALERIQARLGELDSRSADLKRLQAAGTQRVIETLEALRERIGRLESRAAEMSREARAKAGRLDALARHVAVVESRLSTALGNPRERGMGALAKEVERSMPVAG